ncbi:hypothetical protein D6C95_04395 [Aureobasidium pullulans]|nr:hypothetical protein D6C95_04395 [Aureobasidium pullulans]
MAPRSSLKTLVDRRRRADGDEDEESVTGVDDSQSDGSVASDVDNTVDTSDADADASEFSDVEDAIALPIDQTVPQSVGPEKTGRTRSKKSSKGTKQDKKPSNTNTSESVAQGSVAGESNGTDVSTAAAGAPIVSSDGGPARRGESVADRRRREHDDYKKKRDTDPTFIPNRGNFFMHDARTPDQRGFSSYGRGRGGRGRGVPQAPSSHVPPPVERTADAPWTHDLHETINERGGPPARQRPPQFPAINPEPVSRGTSTAQPKPLNFSKTTQIGSVQIRVSLPGMAAAVPFAAVPVKSHTRLPDHRPPLRRDKPVRISMPDHPVRYVFPAAERSFIFIPRALRPNQQGFGKARGSFGAYGAPSSRRQSLFGGSVYSQAMSMSRRSSLARDVPRDSAFSPTGSYTARGHPGSGRPVVRLPQAGSHRSSNPSPAGSAYGRSYPHSYPRPQTPAVEHWAEPDTVHQPRPQKTISMTGIESPAGLALHAPQQQEQQPFHNQLPQHIAEGSISTQSASSDMAPHPLGPAGYMYPSGTPLSNIPERAIHAQPFQPPASNFFSPYGPSGYYYPPQPTQYGAMPSYAPPTAQPSYAPPEAPMASDPQGTMAHESNGMVYYTQLPQYASQEGYLQPYAVPGMGGMMTPSPEGAYYYANAGQMYYQWPSSCSSSFYSSTSYRSPLTRILETSPPPEAVVRHQAAIHTHASFDMPSSTGPVNEDTLITIKVSFDDSTKRLKLPLKDLGANTLPVKLRQVLCIASDQAVVFERYSDSAGGYVVLDDSNPAVFKTLIRAAKAKLKLKLRASAPSEETKIDAPSEESSVVPEAPIAPSRSATTLDQHSIGPGIFEFRDALSSMKTDVEAPVPRPFDFTANTTVQGVKHVLPLRVAQSIEEVSRGPWSVFCNSCDRVMSNVHYHCGVCDGGDFDLCETCITNGAACLGDGHWLVKRSIQDGKVISSTTERFAPKPKHSASSAPLPKFEVVKDIPGAFTDDVKTLSESMRTCNACVVTLPDRDFVTCIQCDDYDLCLNCHTLNAHGHHPGHHFKPAVDGADLSLAQEALLPAGRNFRHTAICDGCDKMIHGVRHKCFDCPDFDYCGECHQNARHTHPRHRFAAIYEHFKGRPASSVSHHGIYCDGPLCKGKPHQSYIQGVRYKCVVCHDTDFCQNCEALPTTHHNKTHPLVKFKTPVNHLTISTESETKHGVRKLGDREFVRNVHSPVIPNRRQSANVTAPVKTVADIKPSPQAEEKKVEEKKEEVLAPVLQPAAVATPAPNAPSAVLQAHFVADRIPDGTVIAPNTRFVQSWTIRNPGPDAWPAGCSVRFVGGDNMLNVDNTQVAAVSDIADATESNVVGREVLPGEAFPFAVTMKAPAREGKCISYWRLKSADGTPFGHRLWCDIDVKNAPVIFTGAAPVPRSPVTVQSTSQAQSYYALYKERMNALKTHLDQTNTQSSTAPTMPAAAAVAAAVAPTEVSEESQKPANAVMVTQTFEVTKTPAEADIEVAESEHEEGELKGSQMVFPTLDKESPSSSTYESFSGSGLSKKAHEETEQASQTSDIADSVVSDDEGFEDITDDLEVLSANEEETSDDGFLTDDDYDILDASDQETVASMK